MAQQMFIVPTDETVPNRLTSTGFVFGAAKVERICTLPKGAVAIGIETKRQSYTIVVSKGGRVRITNKQNVKATFTAPTAAQSPKGTQP